MHHPRRLVAGYLATILDLRVSTLFLSIYFIINANALDAPQ